MMLRLGALLVICASCAAAGCRGTAVERDLPVTRKPQSGVLNVIPKPMRLVMGDGQFTLKPSTAIVLDRGSDELRWMAGNLAENLRQVSGFDIPVLDRPAEGAIVLTLDGADPWLGEEGYELAVEPESVTVRAPAPAGLFYGTQTLIQAFTLGEPKGAADCLRIKDKPRFQWRGFMLDSARHFQQVETVERVLDLLARYKMNRFHMHLNDDEAWRLEISKYPKLTEIGAFPASREKSMGGFYTKAQIRHIVEYARRRHITVIPEIEIPGHATAALYCYPEFTCKGEPFPHGDEAPWYFQGVAGRKAYCPGRPETIEFLRDILTETMDMFDTPYIHIGGDERPGGWAECPRCQQKMKDLGLADENALQNWLMKQVSSFVDSKGRRTVAWAANLRDGIPEGQIIQGWHAGHSAEAVRQGADTINSECGYVYLDFKWPAIGLEQIYSFDPVPPGVTPDQASHVLGAEAPLWTEMVSFDEVVFQRMFPRLFALSEVVWSWPQGRRFSEFEPRAQRHIEWLDAHGIGHHREGDEY